MNFAAVMDELADAVRSIDSLKGTTYAYPIESPPAPAAVVAFPEQITFDELMGRGADDLNIDVVVLVGRMDDRAVRDNAVRYTAGAGDDSIKEAIEDHNYVACDSVRVERCTFDTYTVADTNHVAVVFTVNIIGPGNTN